jgi:hypothetical protein
VYDSFYKVWVSTKNEEVLLQLDLSDENRVSDTFFHQVVEEGTEGRSVAGR